MKSNVTFMFLFSELLNAEKTKLLNVIGVNHSILFYFCLFPSLQNKYTLFLKEK